MFNIENVSYGAPYYSGTITLSDKTSINFADNVLQNARKIDERNLINCKFLNLYMSSIL